MSDRATIEQAARTFLERSRGDGRMVDEDAFEDVVRRVVDLTLRQRRAIRRPTPPGDARGD